jgi:DNA-binding beta-propeller fold protein YncE
MTQAMTSKTFTLAVFFSMSCFATEAHFKIDHRIPLTGSEGWDCLSVDTTSGRLFVSRSNHVDVIDLKTEKLVGTISEHVDGAHAIAFVPSLNKGYITSGKSGQVVVFDLKSLKVLKEVPAALGADIITFDPTTQRVFSFNGRDKSATAIDVKTDSVVGTIKLDGKPEFAVDDSGKIFVNNEDKNSIMRIDANSLKVQDSWPLPGCESPTGLSADLKSRRLFSVCDNEVMAITDADTGKQIKTVKIGKSPDGSEFDQGLIFSSNGSGTLTIVQEVDSQKFIVVENLETQKGARTMTVDPATHSLYLVAAKYEPLDPKNPKERPRIISGSVELLVIKK